MIHFLSIAGSITPKALAINFAKYCAPMGVCGNGEVFFIVFAERVFNLALSVVGGLCVLVIMYGGMRIIASAGNDTARDEGKKAVITALTGLIFCIMAFAIVSFVANFISDNFI